MKKINTLIAVILAALVTLSGCSMIQLNEERDNAVVVAEVNGVELIKGNFKGLYLQYLNYVGLDEQTAKSATYKDTVEQIKQEILNQMADEELQWQMAVERGFDQLTEAQTAEVQENFNAIMDSLLDSYLVDEEGNAIENPTEEQKQEARAKLLADLGIDGESYLDDLKKSKSQELLYNDLTSAASVTPDAVQVKYDELVAADKETYQGNDADYESANADGTVILYVPSGLRYIKHILIAFDSDIQAELEDLRAAESYAEDADAAKAENDAKRDEYLSAIQDETDEVLAKLDNGDMTFEEAMEAYSDDSQDPESKGFVVAAGGATFVPEFTAGAFKLKNVGDYELVPTDFGYHIILYAGDVTPGPLQLTDTVVYGTNNDLTDKLVTVYEYVEEQLLDPQRSDLFDAAFAAEKEKADIKVYYRRVKDV